MKTKILHVWLAFTTCGAFALLAMQLRWSGANAAFVTAMERETLADTLNHSLQTGRAAEQLAVYTCALSGAAILSAIVAVLAWKTRARRHEQL